MKIFFRFRALLKPAVPLLLALCLCCACAVPQPAATPSPTAIPTSAPTPVRELPTPAPTAAIAYPSVSPDAAPSQTPAEGLPEEPRACYDVAMHLLPEERLLVCAMQLAYVNTSSDTLQELCLQLYPNAYSKKEQLTEALVQEYPNGFSAAGLSIEESTVNGAKASYVLSDNDEVLRLTLPAPLLPGETAELYFRYRVTVPEKNGLFGKTELGFQLAYCIPTAAVYENGAWSTHTRPFVGDAHYASAADYRVAFTRPADYVVAASGEFIKDETESDGTVTSYYALSRARDFCLCTSPDYTLYTETTRSGVSVLSYAMTEESAFRIARASRDVLNQLEEWLPPYPYTTYTVVQAELPSAGMEFTGLTMLDRENYLENRGMQLISLQAHEAAHQWFYAAVGNDPYAAPWLDEALSQYLCVKYLMKFMSVEEPWQFSMVADDAAPAYPVDGSVYDYPDDTAYSDAVYRRGGSLFFDLESELGHDVSEDGLHRYYNANAFRLASKDTLIAAFSEAAGRDLTDWFQKALAPIQ
ncbi:MAG: M1 family aminopeptidase [Eubacteriales bacterium]|nr:M1 family aminopeptidase [Eubacteriales bacterium]